MLSTIDTTIADIVRTRFNEKFGGEPIVISSPGRVNLIGEHTDYNEGFVLPAAIDKQIITAVTRRKDTQIHLYSSDLNAGYTGDLDTVRPTTLLWPDYILGVVQQLQKLGLNLSGFNLAFGGDIPMGAGMSSSAALECSVVFALNELFGFKLTKLEMVKLAQRAENQFVGVNCGIMDQFASMFGKKNQAIQLDCRSLEYSYVPFDMEGLRILLLDTGVKHTLGTSEYNVRRKQCEDGVAMVKKFHPHVTSLRDVTLQQLQEYIAPADQIIYKRCRYVVEENTRLLGACEDLAQDDLAAFGRKMFLSHDGLSQLYEVSCPELDFLALSVRTLPGVLGARMMGGGFGGCTINLVREESVEEVVHHMRPLYDQQFGKPMGHYVIRIGDGTAVSNSLR